ncbi:MAG: hypothetical protein ACHQRM_12345 [Bacteroidia bacterium]
MKNTTLIGKVVIITGFVLLLNSCTIQKRLYTKGFYVEHATESGRDCSVLTKNWHLPVNFNTANSSRDLRCDGVVQSSGSLKDYRHLQSLKVNKIKRIDVTVAHKLVGQGALPILKGLSEIKKINSRSALKVKDRSMEYQGTGGELHDLLVIFLIMVVLIALLILCLWLFLSTAAVGANLLGVFI